MYTFDIKAELKHNKGKQTINITSAIEKYDLVGVLEKSLDLLKVSENCPENAIKKISITLQG